MVNIIEILLFLQTIKKKGRRIIIKKNENDRSSGILEDMIEEIFAEDEYIEADILECLKAIKSLDMVEWPAALDEMNEKLRKHNKKICSVNECLCKFEKGEMIP